MISMPAYPDVHNGGSKNEQNQSKHKTATSFYIRAIYYYDTTENGKKMFPQGSLYIDWRGNYY